MTAPLPGFDAWLTTPPDTSDTPARCGACDAEIPERDLEDGDAREVTIRIDDEEPFERVLCSECLDSPILTPPTQPLPATRRKR